MSESFRCSSRCTCIVDTVTVELMLVDLSWMTPERSRPRRVTVYFRLLGLPMTGFTVDCEDTDATIKSVASCSPMFYHTGNGESYLQSNPHHMKHQKCVHTDTSKQAVRSDAELHTVCQSECAHGWNSTHRVTPPAAISVHTAGDTQSAGGGFGRGRWCVFSACQRWLSHRLSHSPLFCAVVADGDHRRRRRKDAGHSGGVSCGCSNIPLAFGAFPMQVVLDDLDRDRNSEQSDGRRSDVHLGSRDIDEVSVSVSDPNWSVSSRRGVAFLRAPSDRRRVARIRFTVRITCIGGGGSALLRDQRKRVVVDSQCDVGKRQDYCQKSPDDGWKRQDYCQKCPDDDGKSQGRYQKCPDNGGKRQDCGKKCPDDATASIQPEIPTNNNSSNTRLTSKPCLCFSCERMCDIERPLADVSSNVFAKACGVESTNGEEIDYSAGAKILANTAVETTAVSAPVEDAEDAWSAEHGCLDADGELASGCGEGEAGGSGDCGCIRIGDALNLDRPVDFSGCNRHYGCIQCHGSHHNTDSQSTVVPYRTKTTVPNDEGVNFSLSSGKTLQSAVPTCSDQNFHREDGGGRGEGDHTAKLCSVDGDVSVIGASPVGVPVEVSRISSAGPCRSLGNDWLARPGVIASSGRSDFRSPSLPRPAATERVLRPVVNDRRSHRDSRAVNSKLRSSAHVYDRMMHGLPSRARRVESVRRSTRLLRNRVRASPVYIQLTRSAQLRLARYVPEVSRHMDGVSCARDKHQAAVELRRQAGSNRRLDDIERQTSCRVFDATRFVVPAQIANECGEVNTNLAPSVGSSIQSLRGLVYQRNVLTKDDVSDSLVERLSSALVRQLQIAGQGGILSAASTSSGLGQRKSVATQLVKRASKDNYVSESCLDAGFDPLSDGCYQISGQNGQRLGQGQMTRTLVPCDNDAHSRNKQKSNSGQMTRSLVPCDNEVYSRNEQKSSPGQITPSMAPCDDDVYSHSDFESDSEDTDLAIVSDHSISSGIGKHVAGLSVSNTTPSKKPINMVSHDSDNGSIEAGRAGDSQQLRDHGRRKSFIERDAPSNLTLKDFVSLSRFDAGCYSECVRRPNDCRNFSRNSESTDSGTVTESRGNSLSRDRVGSRRSTGSESADSGTVTESRAGSLERVESLTEEEFDLRTGPKSARSVLEKSSSNLCRDLNGVSSVSVEKYSVEEYDHTIEDTFESDSVQSLSTLTESSDSAGQRTVSRSQSSSQSFNDNVSQRSISRGVSQSSNVTSESSELSARIERAIRQADTTSQQPLSLAGQTTPWLKNSTHHQRQLSPLADSVHTDSVSSYIPSMIE